MIKLNCNFLKKIIMICDNKKFLYSIIFGIVLGCSIILFYFFTNIYFLIYIYLILSLILLIIYFFIFTEVINNIVLFIQESYLELYLIEWPTIKETLQTTMVVCSVTFIISLMLWILDSFLVFLISYISSLRF